MEFARRRRRRKFSALVLCSSLATFSFVASVVAAGGQQSKPASTSTRLERFQVPAGSALLMKLRTPVDSGSSFVNDQVEAVLWSPVIQDGVELIPVDSVVIGQIIDVVRATEKTPLGALTFRFKVVEHAETKSRASLPTRDVTVEAPKPPPPVEKSRGKAKPKPVDAVLPAGTPLVAVTTEPLVVRIPK